MFCINLTYREGIMEKLMLAEMRNWFHMKKFHPVFW